MFLLKHLLASCVVIVSLHTLPLIADSQTISTSSLDGLQFRGQTGEHGKGDHHEDTITFHNGQFRSLDCEEWGFGPATYHAKKKGDTHHFSATLVSPDRGRLIWHGTIREDEAEAEFQWLHKRWYWTIDRKYWFKGYRQNKP
ncbi:MAG: hypothetical protein KZQ93_02780 [Candidatus Thiodiazotropha sp. (ex Monitilora ramsayi)]|nr:hypothetical protein [Candidatus Thiodiazotropha sp. (ex Monitilora ramsayi)]